MGIKYKMKLNAAKIKRQYFAGKKVVEIARASRISGMAQDDARRFSRNA